MERNTENSGYYGPKSANEFVYYLGLWRHANPHAALERGMRDVVAYRQWLEKLIEVNQTRNDAIGWQENRAARLALARLQAAQ